jgi:acyl carrier protein
MNRTFNDQQLRLDLETVICNVLRVSGPGINPETRMIADLGLESAELMGLSCGLEKLTGAKVDLRKLLRQRRAAADEAGLDVTLGDIVDYVRAQLEALDKAIAE